MPLNLISIIGLAAFIGLAWLFSAERRRINWQLVGWGVGLELLFGLFVFRIPAGVAIFHWLNKVVVKLLSFSGEGAYFLFGPLALPPGIKGPTGESSVGFILAFQVLPTVIFFSALMSLLYHIRLMQKVIGFFARIFTRFMRISGAESFCTATNIFVGIESALTVRPYLETMTHSELCTILTAGMATIASTVLGLYVSFLHTQFPMIAGHLISASILSAPAAIVASKILFPETETPKTLGRMVKAKFEESASWVEAIVRGANDGVRLCVGIIALLMAFLGLLAMLNYGIAGISRIFLETANISIQRILSLVFYPLTLLIGISPNEVGAVATLLGERFVVTELVSYQHLSSYISTGVIKNPRSVVLASYALCGFAHIASLAIFVGGISALVPNRAKDLARLGFRSLFAATLACLLTAAVAGIFYTGGETVLLR